MGDEWRERRTPVGKRGYPVLSLRQNGKMVLRTAQQLVLAAFVGPRPDQMDGCHEDGDRTNCKLEHLRYDTCKNNNADKVRHGTYSTKFSEADVREIRRRRADGETLRGRLISPSPLYSGERGWGEGACFPRQIPLTPDPSPPEYRGRGGLPRRPLREIAADYGAVIATIHCIATRRTWKHIA
jgi:hypothetical protein